jgi:hypothetical protein
MKNGSRKEGKVLQNLIFNPTIASDDRNYIRGAPIAISHFLHSLDMLFCYFLYELGQAY